VQPNRALIDGLKTEAQDAGRALLLITVFLIGAHRGAAVGSE